MDKREINWRYCQSCGMPLYWERDDCFGSNADGSKSDIFCHYCFKDGVYTADVEMSEVIRMWIECTDAYNDYAETNYSTEELRKVLKRRIPSLSRWKQKFETHNVHYRSVQKIQNHINQHLFEEMEVKTLATVGGLSESHFRRVFQNATGETASTHIQRLRLERIANLLITTGYTLDQIVHQTNYTSKNAIAKAFRKHFGMTTSLFKKRYKTPKILHTSDNIKSEIKIINEMYVMYIEVGESYKVEKEYNSKWRRLIEYVQQNDLGSEYGKFISISLDDPLITPRNKCRFYIGVTVPKSTKPIIRTGIFRLSPQKCAIFKQKGNYKSLEKLYKAIYEDWLPQSNCTLSGTITFEIYITKLLEIPLEELETEVCIPIL